jgi:hypothetical protein
MSRRHLPLLAGAASALLVLAVLALAARHAGPLRATGAADADPCRARACTTVPRCVRPRERDAVDARVVPCAPLTPRQRGRSRLVLETRPTIVP